MTQLTDGHAGFGAVPVPGQHVDALRVGPRQGSRGQVVVLPGIHGRTPHILDLGLRLAHRGLDAIIADFYCTAARQGRLRTPEDLTEATRALDHDAIVASALGLVESLRGAGPVVILGYCVGGAVALRVAARTDAVSATVVYYAVVRPDTEAAGEPAPLAAAGQVTSPVLAHYGSTDPWCQAADVDELEKRLAASGAAYEVYRYPGAGHAFEEAGRPGYRPVAAAEARRRTMTFLDHYLAEVRT